MVLVGGGLSAAPVYPQLRAFKEAGSRTTGIIGFRSRDLVFWESRFRRYCDELIVCTDDGSYGRTGFVTAALEELLARDRPDLVVAIGRLERFVDDNARPAMATPHQPGRQLGRVAIVGSRPAGLAADPLSAMAQR